MSEELETDVLTVNEYSSYFNIPVDTVRSRIRLGKLKTTKVERSGRSLTGVIIDHTVTPPIAFDTSVTSSYEDSQKPVSYHSEDILVTVFNSQIDDLKVEIERLRQLAEKWETEANSWRTIANEATAKVAELNARLEKLDVIEKVVSVQQQTIEAQQIANEALNNERVVITQQLQKYRASDVQIESEKYPAWMFWKK